MQFTEIKPEEFDAVFSEMEKNFIKEERRNREDARALLGNPLYRMYHMEQDGQRVGFITIWELCGFAFVEHFVTYEQFRSRGYGSSALALAQERFGRIVLEVEPPETDAAKRRIAFYERMGFCQNDYPYLQPSYHGAGGEVELILMSYPSLLSDPKAVVREMYTKVYKVGD